MSGTKLNDFSTVDVNLTAIMDTLTQATKGHFQLSVTNFTTTDAPAIAAGSIIEVDGAVFKFDTELAITGSVNDGTVYIKLVPAADSCTAEYTNTAPTWSDSKQGWYGTAGTGNNRYVVKLTKSSALYSIKNYLYSQGNDRKTETNIQTYSGTWTSGDEITFTFPFTIAVEAITAFNIQGIKSSSIQSSYTGNAFISAVTISTNSVVIKSKQEIATQTVLMTAALTVIGV